MYSVTTYYDPFLRRTVKWSTWKSGPAPVVPVYINKFQIYRPMQQRPRDGTVVRHKRNRS